MSVEGSADDRKEIFIRVKNAFWFWRERKLEGILGDLVRYKPMETSSGTRRCLASWMPPRLVCTTCLRRHTEESPPFSIPTLTPLVLLTTLPTAANSSPKLSCSSTLPCCHQALNAAPLTLPTYLPQKTHKITPKKISTKLLPESVPIHPCIPTKSSANGLIPALTTTSNSQPKNCPFSLALRPAAS